MTIYETEKGLCLNGPSGPVVGDKVYVNAPERTPQVGDKVIIYQKDDDTFYMYYSEGKKGKGNLDRKAEAREWFEQNL